MSDLIERLRRNAFESDAELRREAADEIERLQAALKEAAKSLAENEQEIERLREAIDHRNYLLEQACKESAKLQAALESIARNTCCEGCQEARRVALAALGVGDA